MIRLPPVKDFLRLINCVTHAGNDAKLLEREDGEETHTWLDRIISHNLPHVHSPSYGDLKWWKCAFLHPVQLPKVPELSVICSNGEKGIYVDSIYCYSDGSWFSTPSLIWAQHLGWCLNGYPIPSSLWNSFRDEWVAQLGPLGEWARDGQALPNVPPSGNGNPVTRAREALGKLLSQGRINEAGTRHAKGLLRELDRSAMALMPKRRWF